MNNVQLTIIKQDDNLQLVNEFLAYMRSDKGCRPKTIRSYRSDLLSFISFFKTQCLLELTEEDIRKYKFYIVSKNLKPRTVNRKMSCLGSFYNYFVNNDKYYISKNPTRNIPKMKVPKTIPIILNEMQSETLLNGILLIGRYGVRDHAIFSTFLFTAVRVSELINLKIHDIDFTHNKIYIRDGKGGKDRVIPMLPRLADALKMYLYNGVQYKEHIIKLKTVIKKTMKVDKFRSGRNYFLNHKTDDESYVFLTKDGNRYSEKGIEHLFKHYTKALGMFKDGLSLHALRRSCLTYLYNEGVDLLKLIEISGHSHIQTLQHYLAIDDEKVAIAMEQHPLASQGLDWNLINLIREGKINQKLLNNAL